MFARNTGRSIRILLLPFVLACFARSGSARGPGALAGTVERELPNGLRLIVREQHGAALVAIDIWVRAGSGREAAGESGAAHFIEHLIFKGTPTRKPGEIDAAIEDLGATANAGTIRDGAHFYTTVATPYVGAALGVLADAVRNATFAPEEVERERSVILDEIARGRNDLHKQALEALYAALYVKHPYGRPVLGLPDSLRNLSREAIAGFHRRLYAPNNTTVVLVGDVAPDAAQALATKLFGDWPRRDVPPAPDEAEPTAQNALNSPRAPIALPSAGSAGVAMGFLVAPGHKVAEACAADLVTTLLGDEIAGRLTRALKPAGLATEVEADCTTLRAPAVLSVYAAAAPDRIPRVRQAMEDEVSRLTAAPPSATELEFAKRRIAGQYLFDAETYAGQARMLGLFDVLGDYRRAMQYVDDIERVTPDQILSFCRTYLTPARRATVVLAPAAAGATK